MNGFMDVILPDLQPLGDLLHLYLIRQFPSTDFILEHDGHAVISVRPASKDEMSAAAATAAAHLSQSGMMIDDRRLLVAKLLLSFLFSEVHFQLKK
jgi:hypothetical protein